jgi:hypothetical protein
MGVTYAKPIVGGMFRVTARLVDKEELDKLLDMAEITMAEEAECQQLAAKAHAPKEEMHDVTSDPKKKGNKKAVADSEKGLDEEQIDELYGTGSLSALAKGHKKAMNAALAADKTKIGTDQRGRSFAYDHDKKSEAAAEYHAGSARRAQVLKKKADIQSGDRDVVRGNAEKRMDNTLKYLRKYTRKEKSKMEESRIDEERKRTASVADAFMKGQKANQRTLRTDGKSVTYHGNTIAKHEGDEVHVTTAGHSHSPSTRGHINGILSRLGSEKLSVKKGQLHHGKNPVDHDAWIKVKKPTVSEEQVEEGTVTGPRSFKGSADRKRKAVQMALGRKNKDHPDWNPRTNPQYSALTLGRQLQKQGVKEETLDETRMPASVIKSKQKIAAMTPEEKAKKFAGKSEEQLKSMARRHGYGKDSNEYSKHVKEETLDEKAPPGREKQVLALKKKFPKGSVSPFAIAWSSYKKSKGE